MTIFRTVNQGLKGMPQYKPNIPPKTNMSFKKGLFQFGIHLPNIDVQARVSFGEGNCL